MTTVRSTPEPDQHQNPPDEPGGSVSRRSRNLGVLALVVAGLMFGTTFLLVKNAIGRAEVAPFLAARFLLAVAVLAPLAFRRPATSGVRRDGIIAGGALLVAYLLQTVGLHDVDASSSAFITYLLVVFVPLMVALRTRTPPSRTVVLGVALAVAGLWLLSGGVAGFGVGELLTLGSAAMFGLHIVVLAEVAHRHDPFRFAFWQILTVAVGSLLPALLLEDDVIGAFTFDAGVWGAVVVCGVGASAIAFWCMSYGQRVVPGSIAAVILLVEPVSAGILGEFVGESLGVRGAVGAVVILAAVLVTELLGRPAPPVLGAEVAVVTDDPPGPIGLS